MHHSRSLKARSDLRHLQGEPAGMADGDKAAAGISGGGDIFGEVLNFFGNYLAWEQTSRGLTRDMRVAEDNAAIAATLSADAIRRGNIEAAKIRLQGTQLAESQRAAYQAGGVDPTVGTPADTAGATAAVTELDAQTAVNNSYREAWGFRRQKSQFERDRENLREEYRAKQDQYSLNQVGTVARGASSLWKTGMKVGG
jgi:hypothetical protein